MMSQVLLCLWTAAPHVCVDLAFVLCHPDSLHTVAADSNLIYFMAAAISAGKHLCLCIQVLVQFAVSSTLTCNGLADALR